ncbi:MAG TPA: hypothetical protein VG674_17290 [Amycolatopsis sp.]|nr:hypothetical protein [Amycolatopsis sp.]
MSDTAARLAAARAAQDAAGREHSDRRALRDRHVGEATSSAGESLRRAADAHGRYLTRAQDLARRHRASGGWLTERAQRDSDITIDLALPPELPLDDEPPVPGRPPREGPFDDHDFSNNQWMVD